MKTRTRAALTARFQDTIIDAKAALEAWTTRLAESPAYAFTWSEKAFAAAAEVEVFSACLGMVEAAAVTATDEEVTTRLLEIANDRVRQGAKYPARSTSVQSNLMEQANLVVWANLAEYLEGRWM